MLWDSRRCDGPVSLQPGRVPDLSLDGEAVDLHRPRAELHPDGGAAVMVELVFGEARQQVALSDPRLSDQNHCEWNTFNERIINSICIAFILEGGS